MDLAHIKELKLTSDIEAFSEDIRVSTQKHFQGVIQAKALRIVYGSTLADNRVLTFLCPPEIAGEFWIEISFYSQCGNFMIFLSLRFYVKTILENLDVLKLQFLPFECC